MSKREEKISLPSISGNTGNNQKQGDHFTKASLNLIWSHIPKRSQTPFYSTLIVIKQKRQRL